MQTRARLLIMVCALLAPAVAAADVIQRSPGGFTVKTVVTIAGSPDRVFGALTRDVGRWWDSQHTFSGDAANLSISPTAGGCFCETLAKGGAVQHAVVIHVVPGQLLRLTGALGPLQEAAVSGTLTWQLSPAAPGSLTTSVTYAVAGAYPGGLEKLAGAVDTVIGDQLRRLKTFVEAP